MTISLNAPEYRQCSRQDSNSFDSISKLQLSVHQNKELSSQSESMHSHSHDEDNSTQTPWMAFFTTRSSLTLLLACFTNVSSTR